MSQLNLYSIFYLNLLYSSVSIKDRATIIKRCYWPLLDLVENGARLGIQISGVTLEIINELDSEWVKRFTKCLVEKKCEFIGGGYAQVIAPSVPAKVSHYNQLLGLKTYKQILNIRPKIATISEMAFSAGIVEHYLDNAYKAIIMEWNNPKSFHSEWSDEWRYYPQRVVGADGRKMRLLWGDSIAFQKFQRYAHGEYYLDEYLDYLNNHLGEKPRYFPLYASDTEIFNYRPGRYKTEAKLRKLGEWKRVFKLFKVLEEDKRFRLVLLSQVLKETTRGHSLHLQSLAQPIPVKKQEKYNIHRWLSTGRDDLGVNTKCFQIYDKMRLSKSTTHNDWKELSYLWASDFRTHITQNRWKRYQRRLNKFHKKWVGKKTKKPKTSLEKRKLPYKDRRVSLRRDRQYLSVENKNMKILFNRLKGLTINGCWFKNVYDRPLFGTLLHGYYEDISFGADFFSGHSIIEIPGQHKITDLDKNRISVFLEEKEKDVYLKLTNKKTDITLYNEVVVAENMIVIKKKIILPQRKVGLIHPFHCTFIPTSWHKQSLFFSTHNGGSVVEKYNFSDRKINHGEPVSLLVSAKQALGATQGVITIGDREKELSIWHDQTTSALVPMIHYTPMDNGQYFLRLLYSAQEMDETFKENEKKQKLEFCWKITANK